MEQKLKELNQEWLETSSSFPAKIREINAQIHTLTKNLNERKQEKKDVSKRLGDLDKEKKNSRD